MGGNTFGKYYRVTTWGESHGPALGVVIDGCPPNLRISEKDIQKELGKRKPGKSPASTSRREQDKVQILSGIFEGKTTGTPISLFILNNKQKSEDYLKIKNLYRPGHADLAYDIKYGVRDYRGGGRASGRETAARVMAGAIAKKYLKIEAKSTITGHTLQIGNIRASKFDKSVIAKNQLKCADPECAKKMENYILKIKKTGDSCGGIAEFIVKNVPGGLGEPVFDKLEADLAKALFSIPAVKGVEFGSGFQAALLKGSENNDRLIKKGGSITSKTNNAGGIYGGISVGTDIVIRVAVKPPSSILKIQKTVDKSGTEKTIKVEGRHDACIVPRLIPVAESMIAITLMDHYLRQKAIR